MTNDESHHEKELGGKLLASVSRSFYLTLKALPRELREPVSLAYLLARTADTIADTSQIDATIRLECLGQFDDLIQTGGDGAMLARRLRTDFTPHQTDEAEATLMQRVQDALAWLRTMDGVSLPHIRNVLATIIRGQRLDIQRFPGGELRSLQTSDELDGYTYLVAGCVGEFWTKLCFERLSNAFVADVTEAQAIERGIRFGKGLQLVNILRDIGKDARLGRCYLPAGQHGLVPAQIVANPAALRPAWTLWLAPCAAHLREGLAYVQSIQHGTLRYATALPLLLAARTLAMLKSASDAELVGGVKVSRFEVTKLLAQTALATTPAKLEKLFIALSD